MYTTRLPSLRLVLYVLVVLARQLVVTAQFGLAGLINARAVYSTIGLVLLVAVLGAGASGRAQRLRLAVADLFLAALACVDLLHFRAFGDLPTVASLRFLSQVGAVAPAILDLLRPWDLALLAGLPVLLLPAGPRRWPALAGRVRAAIAVVAVLLLVLPVVGARHRKRYKGNGYFAAYVGIAGYHATDALAYVGKLSHRIGGREEAARRVRAALAGRAPLPASPLHGKAEGRNVIVIQLESFQGFAIGRQVDGQPLTPNLDALARESIHFGNFFEQAAYGRTSDAQFVSNCSLFPAQNGAVVFEYAGNDFRCLPTVLAERGYHTALYQPLNRDFWNSAVFDPRLGFREVVSAQDLEPGEKIGLGLSDEAFFAQVAPRLRALPEPFYAWVLSVTSHTPYEHPALPRTLELGALEGTRAGWYLHAVHYTDGALGRLLDELRKDGLLDRSLLVVFGDHDGLTRQTGNLTDLLPFGEEDELAFFREEHRVPLFVRLPGGGAPVERSELGGQIDLAPTLLGLLGIDQGEMVALGRDLFAEAEPERAVVFPSGAVLAADRVALADGRCFGERGALPARACAGLADRYLPLLGASAEILDRDLVPMLYEAPALVVDVE